MPTCLSTSTVTRAALAFLLLSGLALAYSSEIYEAAAEESHRRMVEELDQLEAAVDEQNPFLSIRQIQQTQEELDSLPDGTPLRERGIVLGFLGYYHLSYGETERAIELLEEARSHFKQGEGKTMDPELRLIEGSLALAYLRLAEDENCCADVSPESCIFPIRGNAVHTRQEGARKALELFTRSISTRRPDELIRYEEMWLANLALMVLGKSNDSLPEEWRIPASFSDGSTSGFPEFRNVAARARVDAFGLSGGAVADDFDGDGIFDLVVSRWEPYAGMKYFKGRGDLTFEDLTPHSNLEDIRGGLNVKQVDFDNDGDLDLYVMRGAWLGESGRQPNSLLRNDGVSETGGVQFTDVTFAVGLGDQHYPSQTSDWADYDLDGDLDLFVGNESRTERYPCQLFRNDGPDENGIPRFTDVAEAAGVETFAMVKGVVWGDYDGDRYPDLFLSCINGRNYFWRNEKNGTFTDITHRTGTLEPLRSFPTWFWDFNNDGHLDLFVSDYSGDGVPFFLHATGRSAPDAAICRLYQNDGRGGFLRVERAVGLDLPMLPMGSNFGDLTNDGFPDMYLGTGDPDFTTIVPNLLLSNEEGRFVDRTVESRLGHLQKGHAVSMADFDRDGDLDIFEQMGGAYRCDPFYDALFENPGIPERSWISVKLKGTLSNTQGIGSRVRVVANARGKLISYYQWMNSGGSFGANPLELHFGLANAATVDRIEVFWPLTGETQVVVSPEIRSRILIVEGE